MTRLTHTQAVEFVEAILDCPVDLDNSGVIEAFVFGADVADVQLALDVYAEGRGINLDPASVRIVADHLDDNETIPAAKITIKTEV